jgi:hypothetical protein
LKITARSIGKLLAIADGLKSGDLVFSHCRTACRPAAKGEAAIATAFDFRELLSAEKPHAMFRNWDRAVVPGFLFNWLHWMDRLPIRWFERKKSHLPNGRWLE